VHAGAVVGDDDEMVGTDGGHGWWLPFVVRCGWPVSASPTPLHPPAGRQRHHPHPDRTCRLKPTTGNTPGHSVDLLRPAAFGYLLVVGEGVADDTDGSELAHIERRSVVETAQHGDGLIERHDIAPTAGAGSVMPAAAFR